MLALAHVTCRFGRTLAVDDVSLEIAGGRVVGLVGENAAGKTTLMRIAAGEITPDRGEVVRPERVGMVHQHFALVSELTVAENLALLDGATFRFTTPSSIEEQARKTIVASGIDLQSVSRRVAELSVGEKAKLELVKAMAVDPRLLILDEPTSVLTPVESAELFAVIRRLAAAGTSVVFISHKVAEVLQIADRVVVMREGRIVADMPASATNADSIAEAMVLTRPPAQAPPSVPRSSTIRLRLEQVSGEVLRDVALTLHANEILAVVGVAGNGQSELAEILRGIRTPSSGTLDFRTRRVAFIPEDRTRDGLIAEMTIAENLALGERRWSRPGADRRAAALIEAYRIRAFGTRQRAGDLSGGNQQKVVLARELDRRPELIIAAEPTRGLDIEAASYVHEQLRKAMAAGAGILIITSDLDEAFALAGAVHVIFRGTLSRPLLPEEAAANAGALLAGLR